MRLLYEKIKTAILKRSKHKPQKSLSLIHI